MTDKSKSGTNSADSKIRNSAYVRESNESISLEPYANLLISLNFKDGLRICRLLTANSLKQTSLLPYAVLVVHPR